MSGISWIDIFLRLIPEGLIIILAGYAVSKKAINAKLYLVSAAILAFITFVFKVLPITPALPMILSAIAAVIILTFINKIKVVHAIISTTACLLLTVLTEGINIFALEKLFHIDTYQIFQHSTPLIRNLYGLPCLFLWAAIVIVYYIIRRTRETKKNVTNE